MDILAIDEAARDAAAQIATAVSAVAASRDARLVALGSDATARSLADARAVYEDATQFVERWANLNAWAVTGGQVSNGGYYSQVVGGVAGRASARATSIPAGASARIKGSIDVKAGQGSSPSFTLIGVSNAAAGAAPTSNAGFIGIGVNELRQPVFFAGSGTGATSEVIGSALPVAGRYDVTITIDDRNISFVLVNASGSLEFSRNISRTATLPVITNLIAWNSDGRELTGHAILALGVRSGIATMTGAERTSIEGAAPSPVVTNDYVPTTPQAIRVSLPPAYDSRKPSPLVLFTHGSSGTQVTPLEPGMTIITQALAAAGYIVASSLQHGNNWGNQSGIDDMVNLYRYVRDRYAIASVVVLGQSMGGLSSLSLLADDRIPGIAAWAGIYPVTNLRNLYDIGTYTAAIRTAYGIAADGSDYASKTDGRDPNLLTSDRFRSVPMRVYASPADTVVPKVTNTDLFISKFNAADRVERSVVVCSGQHGDISHFQGADLIAFFARATAR